MEIAVDARYHNQPRDNVGGRAGLVDWKEEQPQKLQ
jgi:hypothetical protein